MVGLLLTQPTHSAHGRKTNGDRKTICRGNADTLPLARNDEHCPHRQRVPPERLNMRDVCARRLTQGRGHGPRRASVCELQPSMRNPGNHHPHRQYSGVIK